MSLQTYLASKYMSGPKADAILNKATAGKKRKRKNADVANATASGSGASSRMIVDDDGGWGTVSTSKDDEQEDVEDVIVASDRSFKKRTAAANENADAGWITLKEPTPPPEADEQPLVVEDEPAPAPRKGGLMTAAQLRQQIPKKAPPKPAQTEQEQETVYRDASGRRIDTKAERAEAARKKREREEKEAEKMEWGKGIVQKEEEERKRAELALESTRDLARYANDKSLNDLQKSETRWNDPAAAFITKKREKGPRKPEYKGPAPPPNRFGIKPGYRWDGVDRGNGFEKKLFQKSNERSRHGASSHDWSVEDM